MGPHIDYREWAEFKKLPPKFENPQKKILKNPQTHLLLFYNEQAWEPSAPKVNKVTPVNYPQLE